MRRDVAGERRSWLPAAMTDKKKQRIFYGSQLVRSKLQIIETEWPEEFLRLE
jgi:hypothetical protein